MKKFRGVIRTNFHINKVPKAANKKSPYKCLLMIKLESIIRSEENLCYPPAILKECKYDLYSIRRNIKKTY